MAAIARVQWDYGKVILISETLPRAAHQIGMLAAGEAAASAVNAKSGRGFLEADLRTPEEVTTLSGAVGSSLPYAHIQHEGGTIVSKGDWPMLIHGISGAEGEAIYGVRYPAGTPGGIGGQFATEDVVAAAYSVEIPAKRYLDAAAPAYEGAVVAAMAEGFPP